MYIFIFLSVPNPMLILWLLSWDPHSIGGLCYTAIPVEMVSEISVLYPEHASIPADISPTNPGILSWFSRSSDLQTAKITKTYNLTHIPARAFSVWPETRVRK